MTFDRRDHIIKVSIYVTFYYTMGAGGSFPGKGGRGMKLFTHFHLVLRPRMVKPSLHYPIRHHGVVFN
jgi:hypothetical protein